MTTKPSGTSDRERPELVGPRRDERRRPSRRRSPNGSTRAALELLGRGRCTRSRPRFRDGRRRAARGRARRGGQLEVDARGSSTRRRRGTADERRRWRMSGVDREDEQADRRARAAASSDGCRARAPNTTAAAISRRSRAGSAPSARRSGPHAPRRRAARAGRDKTQVESRARRRASPIDQAIGVEARPDGPRASEDRRPVSRLGEDRGQARRDRHADRREQVHPERRLAEWREDDRAEPAEDHLGREAGRMRGPEQRADGLELGRVPERDPRTHASGPPRPGRRRPTPAPARPSPRPRRVLGRSVTIRGGGPRSRPRP